MKTSFPDLQLYDIEKYMKKINLELALKIIKEGNSLKNLEIDDILDFSDLEIKKEYEIREKIFIENCIIQQNLLATSAIFTQKFILKNSTIKGYSYFCGGHFPNGLEIINCKFEDDVSFMAGGDNVGTEFRIENNHFKEFVDFSDAIFQGPFILKNNIFEDGTNLLLEYYQLCVSFEDIKIIENNIGNLKQEASSKLGSESIVRNISFGFVNFEEINNKEENVDRFIKYVEKTFPNYRNEIIKNQLNRLYNYYNFYHKRGYKDFIDIFERHLKET